MEGVSSGVVRKKKPEGGKNLANGVWQKLSKKTEAASTWVFVNNESLEN